jgi:hypothetical protein
MPLRIDWPKHLPAMPTIELLVLSYLPLCPKLDAQSDTETSQLSESDTLKNYDTILREGI